MDGCIAHVVFLKHLRQEDYLVQELLQGLKCIVLGANVEDCLVLVIAQVEVVTRAVEVLLQHGHIVVAQGVVQGQVAVVVHDVGSGADLINDRVLLVYAYDVLNGLTLVVLHATRFEKLVAAAEPIEDVLVAVASAFEKWVLTKVVTLLECLIPVLLEDLEHRHVLALNSREEGRVSLEIGLHALLRSLIEKSPG